MAHLREQCLLLVAGEKMVLRKMLESVVTTAVLVQRRAIRLPMRVVRRVGQMASTWVATGSETSRSPRWLARGRPLHRRPTGCRAFRARRSAWRGNRLHDENMNGTVPRSKLIDDL